MDGIHKTYFFTNIYSSFISFNKEYLVEIISQQERHYLQPGAVCIRFLLAWNERFLSFIKY